MLVRGLGAWDLHHNHRKMWVKHFQKLMIMGSRVLKIPSEEFQRHQYLLVLSMTNLSESCYSNQNLGFILLHNVQNTVWERQSP